MSGRIPVIFILLFTFAGHSLPAGNNLVKVNIEQSGSGELKFYADNFSVIPCVIIVKLTELSNMECTVKNPYRTVLPPEKAHIYLFSLRPKSGTPYKYSYYYRYFLGDPSSVKHTDSYPYLLPFEHGTKHYLVQGYNGNFSHRGIFALDFAMDIGTPVTAARDGITALVKNNSGKGGPDPAYRNDANYVLIYHNDGSFGNYMHFRKNGIVVKVGDTVKAGQILGYSGNTGYSSGPHIHFDVSIPTYDGSRRTIPTGFLNYDGYDGYDGSLISLTEGHFYYSIHPGYE
ncbi:MAG: M23 family metallopeptidase [Spirochaetes bacterium]|nr:M23 family metallopeptidase [Spirochaetota bacterium]